MHTSVNLIEKLILLTKEKYNYPIVYSKDCETLSHAIFNKTNSQLSATTLKRLLGFAKAKDKPSKFTLNTLAVYCGYTDWVDFIENENTKPQTKPFTKWISLQERATAVSNYTLEALKNNSGLSYKHTIKREFAFNFMNEFLKSGSVATCFVADGGMGKSISIAQVVEDYWLAEKPKYKNDIVWFISGTNFRGLFAKQFDVDSWFLDMFGLTSGTDYRNYFYKHPKERKGNIILVIDALDELVIKSEELDDLFRKIIETIGSNTHSPWFKIILTTRTSTFERLIHITKDYSGVSKYFFGVNFDNLISTPSNVPLLSQKEILQIIKNVNANHEIAINPIDFERLNDALRQQITHPYYLQLFIQSCIESSIHIHSNYDILNEFMRHRIFKGKYGFEKSEIFNAILLSTDYGRKASVVKKIEINPTLLQYKRAYNELVSYGILKELSILNKFKVYVPFIKFGHDNLFEFLIAKHLIEEHGTFSHELLQKVTKNYVGNEKRIDIIKHITLMGLEEGKYEELQFLFSLPLKDYELNTLGHVLGMHIRENKEAQKTLLPLWAKNKNAQIFFFERFVDLDNLNGYYGDAIKFYLQHKKGKESQIFGHSLLFMRGFLSNNEALYEKEGAILEEYGFDMAVHPFPLGRQMACHILSYQKFHQRKLSDRLKSQILKIAKSVAHKKDFVTGFPAGYHFHVLEGLYLAKEYDVLINVFELVESDFPEMGEYKQTWLYKMMQVYYSVALKMLGRKANALNLFKTLDFEQAFKDVPWYKNYFLIQYLNAKFLMTDETKERTALSKQIDILSNKLGFCFN